MLGKMFYPTRRIAKSEAKRISRNLGKRLRYYKCDDCFGYHHTSYTRENMRSLREKKRRKLQHGNINA